MWIIKDWADNIMFDGRGFETFEDGWGFIMENIEDVDNAYDDVFVIEKEL
jgi:hypothetical protein